MLPRRVWDTLRSLGSTGAPYAELRGWRFELVAPRYRYRPSPSELASPCPSRRDLYLRHVLHAEPPESSAYSYGVLVHEFLLEPFRLVRQGRSSVDDLAAGMRGLARRLGARPTGFLRRVYSLGAALALQSLIDPGVPVSVEPTVPGAPVGLSDNLRPDLLVGLIPVEVTTSSPYSPWQRKELQLAGYALAIEAWTGVPVDYGVLLHVTRRGEEPRLEWRVVGIDDPLRQRLLRARDEAAMIVENGVDPGPAAECPPSCPFRGTAGCPPPPGQR